MDSAIKTLSDSSDGFASIELNSPTSSSQILSRGERRKIKDRKRKQRKSRERHERQEQEERDELDARASGAAGFETRSEPERLTSKSLTKQYHAEQAVVVRWLSKYGSEEQIVEEQNVLSRVSPNSKWDLVTMALRARERKQWPLIRDSDALENTLRLRKLVGEKCKKRLVQEARLRREISCVMMKCARCEFFKVALERRKKTYLLAIASKVFEQSGNSVQILGLNKSRFILFTEAFDMFSWAFRGSGRSREEKYPDISDDSIESFALINCGACALLRG